MTKKRKREAVLIAWALTKYGESLSHVDEDFVYFIDGTQTENTWHSDKLAQSVQKIERHIYSFYSEKKQAQDSGWKDYAQTVIIGVDEAVTLDSLSREVMASLLSILSGATPVSDFSIDRPEALKPHYEKLIKVALRLKWAKMCIDEGKLAISEDRAPIFPSFDITKG